jgi:hypothetical protein
VKPSKGMKMKNIHYIIALLVVALSKHDMAHAIINFGSADSCIMVVQGTLDLGDASLSDGCIRDTTQNGGLVMANAECARMTLELDTIMDEASADITTVLLNGVINIGGEGSGTIVLGSGESLAITGGVVTQTIYINGTAESPSMLQGIGSLVEGVTINDMSHGVVSWDGPLNTNIGLNASAEGHISTLRLASNLVFAPYSMVTALDASGGTNAVYFDGFKMFFGGDEDAPTIIYNSHEWRHANVQLTGPVLLDEGKQIILKNNGYMNGGGNVWHFNLGASLDFDDDTIICANMVFTGYVGACLQNGSIECEDVTFALSDTCSFTVRRGSLSGLSIDPFAGNVDIDDAQISLHTDLSITGTWTIVGDTTIDGGGHHVDLSSGTLMINEGNVLTLRNVVLDNVVSSSLDGDGTLNLAHVTVIVDSVAEDLLIDWSAACPLIIDGPVTFVTGIKMISVAEGSTINNVTAYYDTLGAGDYSNVGGFTGSGRLQWVDHVELNESGSILIAGSTRLSQSLYLYPVLAGTDSCTITFSRLGGGAIQYDGRGRTLYCPHTTPDVLLEVGDTEHVLFVDDATHAYTTNITIDGFKPAHLHLADSETDELAFGDNTLVILRHDFTGEDALDMTLKFGFSSATDQTMVLNLNGHTIDFEHADAGIMLQGGSDSTLRIKNGRLLNVSGEKLWATGNNTIIFDSVDMVLIGDTLMNTTDIRIEGHCHISGIQGTQFEFQPSMGTGLTIARNATLTVGDGITYIHHSSEVNDFIFEHATSQLELLGGTFMRDDEGASAPLALTRGRLVVEHRSYMSAGNQGITVGDGVSSQENLTIDFRPGATLTVLSGALTYDNVSGG